MPSKSQLNRKWLEMLALMIPILNSLFTIVFIKIRSIAVFFNRIIGLPLFIVGIIPKLNVNKTLVFFANIEIK